MRAFLSNYYIRSFPEMAEVFRVATNQNTKTPRGTIAVAAGINNNRNNSNKEKQPLRNNKTKETEATTMTTAN